MRKNRTGFGSFMSGLLFGGFLGGLTALIIAPQSGKQTREEIRTKSLVLKDKAEQTMEESLATIRQASDNISEQVAALQTHQKGIFEQSQKQWKQAIEEIGKITQDAVEEIKTTAVKPVERSQETLAETGEQLPALEPQV